MTKLTNDAASNIALVKQLVLESFKDMPLLAELTICQAILEAGLRNSPPSLLAFNYCNLFGMKPGYTRTGTAKPGVVDLYTNEYIHGKGMVKIMQPFLSNLEIEDSIKQHKKLLVELDRYSNLTDATTFEEIAHMIHDDGYATDPDYPQLLIDIHKTI